MTYDEALAALEGFGYTYGYADGTLTEARKAGSLRTPEGVQIKHESGVINGIYTVTFPVSAT
jgi:hypothetical protein